MSQAQYAAEIANLIQKQGEGQADAARASGQIWGNLANNLGQLPQQLVGMQRARDEAELRKLETQQKKQQINGEQALNDSMKNALVTNPDGTTTFNQDAVIHHLTASGFGSKVPAYQKMMSDADTAAATLAKTRADVAAKQSDLKGALAASVKEQGYDVPSFTLMLSHATAQKLITPQEGQQALQMAIDNPESVKKLTDTWLAASPGQQKLAVDRQIADAHTLTAQTGVANAQSMAEVRKAEVANKAADNARQDAQAGETGRHNKVMETAAMIRARRPPASGASQAPPEGDFTKEGKDFLATVPIQWRKTVEKIANYDEDPTKSVGMRSGNRDKITQWVNQVNPNYDASKFALRNPTRKAFTTGTQGQQINAINTAIGHIDQLTNLSSQLENGGFVPANKAWNTVRTMFGSDKVTNFDTLKDALAGEVSSVLAKGGATVSGIAEAKQHIKDSSSPTQLAGYVKTLVPVMGSKLAELDYQFKQAMGEGDSFSALSPESKRILAKHGFDPDHPTIGQGGGGGGPKVGDTKTFPNGSKGQWDGHGWVKIGG